jgi:hypothetical protein
LFQHAEGNTTSLVHEEVPETTTAGAREKPQIPTARVERKTVKHKLRIIRRQPLFLGHRRFLLFRNCCYLTTVGPLLRSHRAIKQVAQTEMQATASKNPQPAPQ